MSVELTWARACAPCSTANLGPGFDVFGLALDLFYDTVTVRLAKSSSIRVRGSHASGVPDGFSENSAGVVAYEFLKRLGKDAFIEIELEKGVPIGMGLGSSGASAAATALALNRLFGEPFEKKELVEIAAEGERASAGEPHADNVSASLLGGFTLIRSYRPLDVVHVEPPVNLGVVVAIPKVEVPPKKTGVSRSVLPKSVSLEKVVHNVGHASAIALGMAIGDLELVGRGMSDAIVEPAREKLVPGYTEVRQSALRSGALGVAISGAGPSMLALVDTATCDWRKVAEAVEEAYSSIGINASIHFCRPSRGAKIVAEG